MSFGRCDDRTGVIVVLMLTSGLMRRKACGMELVLDE